MYPQHNNKNIERKKKELCCHQPFKKVKVSTGNRNQKRGFEAKMTEGWREQNGRNMGGEEVQERHMDQKQQTEKIR
jgi:hypothetical protein